MHERKKKDELNALMEWLSDKPDFELRHGPQGKGRTVFVKSCNQVLNATLEQVQQFYDGKNYQGYLISKEWHQGHWSSSAADNGKAEKTVTISSSAGSHLRSERAVAQAGGTAQADDVAQKLLAFIDLNGGKVHSGGGYGDKMATVPAFYRLYPGAQGVVGKLMAFCSRYDEIGFRPDGRGTGTGWLYRVPPS